MEKNKFDFQELINNILSNPKEELNKLKEKGKEKVSNTFTEENKEKLFKNFENFLKETEAQLREEEKIIEDFFKRHKKDNITLEDEKEKIREDVEYATPLTPLDIEEIRNNTDYEEYIYDDYFLFSKMIIEVINELIRLDIKKGKDNSIIIPLKEIHSNGDILIWDFDKNKLKPEYKERTIDVKALGEILIKEDNDFFNETFFELLEVLSKQYIFSPKDIKEEYNALKVEELDYYNIKILF